MLWHFLKTLFGYEEFCENTPGVESVVDGSFSRAVGRRGDSKQTGASHSREPISLMMATTPEIKLGQISCADVFKVFVLAGIFLFNAGGARRAWQIGTMSN